MGEPDGPSPPRPEYPSLPPEDRITGAERLRTGWHRFAGRVRCRFGLHDWARRENPEVGGPQAVYHQCRRCGHEYSPPDPRQTWM